MRPLRTFKVESSLPDELAGLSELAHNLRWSWRGEIREIFRRLDPALWEECVHNPVAMLGRLDQSRLDRACRDAGFMAQYRRVHAELKEYLTKESWWDQVHGRSDSPAIVYFCAEFGLTECIPNYSGGLGVLAGDHLKSASELGLPLIGMGLLYQKGYFRQRLNADGWQLELFPHNDFYNLPVQIVRGAGGETSGDGEPLKIGVDFPGRTVTAQIWVACVGRIKLYLLDTNVPENSPEDRQITGQLYGGDQEMRIRQEIVLGIGGVRALGAMQLKPKAYHMNEGHSAFLGIERIRIMMEEQGVPFPAAREAVAASSIFTTHTPVPAGNDAFEPWLVERYFKIYWERLGITRDEFLALGRQDGSDGDEPMNLTVLAIRLSNHRNGVSRLHAEVSRRLWSGVWPSLPIDEIPIGHVTNGVHTGSWISFDQAGLYDRYLGPDWQEQPTDPRVWEAVDQIPDTELWRTHERRRERLVAFARRRLREQLERSGAGAVDRAAAEEVLDPDALTIGFARRFATYKRATLILQDVERLARLLNQPGRPVQILFAGKAHPRDNPGKELIRQLVHITRQAEFRRNVVFLEDYDMNLARYLVQGVDVWLNTPLRPMEASGTSGMKVAANGGLNVSVLDGWWEEGCEHDVGWAIGSGESYEDLDYQNAVESQALYDLLEKEVVPAFYGRGHDGLPREWIARMKAAMRKLTPVFNTNRMVREYAEKYYLPAIARWEALTADGVVGAQALADWKRWVYENFDGIRVESVSDDMTDGKPRVGTPVSVEAAVQLGLIHPRDVSVHLYHGLLNSDGQLEQGQVVEMDAQGAPDGDGRVSYRADMPCQRTGLSGYTVRVLPKHPDLPDPQEMGLVRWA